MNGGHDGFDSNGPVLDFQTIQRDVLGRKGDASDCATRPNHHIQNGERGSSMPEFTLEEVIERVARGESLERADLRELDLAKANLDNANLRRADLEGANLEEATLRRANLASVSLRDAFLVRANLEGANLRGADLESANLEGANLRGADLSRANLEGANLEGADLTGARLPSAQLIDAKLGVATLENAVFANADLRNAYLGGANLTAVDFQNAILESANFEEALLTGANLRDAVLRRAALPGADLSGAKLERAVLEGADLSQVSLLEADCRHATFHGARLKGAKFSRTHLYGSDFSIEVADGAEVDEVDFSVAGDGSQLIPASALAAFLNGKTDGGTASPQAAAVAVAPIPTNRRYFGHGDVLRDASLEFDADSIVEVDGRFLKCNITLGQGAQLIIGREGLLDGCQVHGSGILVIHGRFTSEASPGIDGARRIIVGATGCLRATVKQPAGHTHFAFEPGCVLRLKTETA